MIRYFYEISNSQQLNTVVIYGGAEFNISLLSCLTNFLDVMFKDNLRKKTIIVHVHYKNVSVSLKDPIKINNKVLQLYLFTFNELYTKIFFSCHN